MQSTDIRDTSKIANLPDDLRAIADQMIADKFNLALSGEVLEDEVEETPVLVGISAGEILLDEYGTALREDYSDIIQDIYARDLYLRKFIDSSHYNSDTMTVSFNMKGMPSGIPCGFSISSISIEDMGVMRFRTYLHEKIKDMEQMISENIAPRYHRDKFDHWQYL